MRWEIADLRRRDEVCLWPVYFDSKRTKAEGRRIPKRLGKSSPNLGMIAKALENLGYSYRLVPEAAHPYLPWKETGLILVKKAESKNRVLKEVSKELSRLAV